MSTTGYVFLVNNGAVSWRSSKTPLQVLNAAEAELVSLSCACQELVYLRKLCIECGFPQSAPTIIYEDSTAAVALSQENRFRNRSKHISVRWSYVAEKQRPDVGELKVVGVSSTIQLADIMASPHSDSSFHFFRNEILGQPTTTANFILFRDAILGIDSDDSIIDVCSTRDAF